MSTKTKIAGLMMAVMALSAPVVWADNSGADKDSWHQGGDWHHGQEGQIFAKILGLSDDQQKQLNDNRTKQKEAMKAFFDQIKSNREALNSEIIKATPDMNKVNQIETQIKTIQSQMVDNHLSSIMEIKKILTPEQFAGYMTLKKERMMMKQMMKAHQFGFKGGFGKDDGDCRHGGDRTGDGDRGHFDEDRD